MSVLSKVIVIVLCLYLENSLISFFNYKDLLTF